MEKRKRESDGSEDGAKRRKAEEKEEESQHLVHPSFTSLHQTKPSPRFPKAFHLPWGAENPLALLSFNDLEEKYGDKIVVVCPEDSAICRVTKSRQFLQATPLWRKNSLLEMSAENFLTALKEWREEDILSDPPALPGRATLLVCVAPAPAFILDLLFQMLTSQGTEKEFLLDEIKLLNLQLDAIELSSGGASSLQVPLSRLLLLLTGTAAKFVSSFRGIGDGVVDTFLPSLDEKLESAMGDLPEDCWPEDALRLNPTSDELIYGQHFDWEDECRADSYVAKRWEEGMSKQAGAICRVIARAGRENLIQLARAPFLPSGDQDLMIQFAALCRRVHALSPPSCQALVQALLSHPLGCRLLREKWFYEHYGNLSPHALRILSVEENRGARARAWLYAEGKETFVFSLEEGAEIAKCGNAPVSVVYGDLLENRGRHLLGGIWDSLAEMAKDPSLPTMWVTGSLASAAILIHPDEQLFESFENMVACRYFVAHSGGRKVGNEITVPSDCDISVDCQTTDELLLLVSKLHVSLNSRGMNYSLERLKPSKVDGKHWKYSLVPSDKRSFRSIEIYRAPPSRIWAHHLAPVRLAFRVLPNGEAEGWLTASALLAAFTLESDFNRCWLGTVSPYDVIYKYSCRGWKVRLPQGIQQSFWESIKGMFQPIYQRFERDSILVEFDKANSTWQDISVMARFPALFLMPRGGGDIAAQLELGAWRNLLQRVKQPLKGTVVYLPSSCP